MKVVVYFFAAVACAVPLPLEVPSDIFDELVFPDLTPKNIYVTPINSTQDDLRSRIRIIGGTEVAPNSIPYQVAVIINSNGLCSGSLISTTHILTAAHCTASASFVQVRLGAHCFNSEEHTQVRLTSTDIKNHESYNPYVVANDISIVFLPSPVTLNDYIQVIPLASADAGTFEDTTALLAGWGRTSDISSNPSPVLHAVDLPIITNAVCRNAFGPLITSSILCTSGNGPAGACNGDSGGPLVVDGVQVGITSFGTTACEGGNPTGYTRISSFRAWISEQAGV